MKKNVKKIMALAIALLLMVTMLVPAAAADEPEIKKGTPVVDGEIDEIYLDSAVAVVDHSSIVYLPIEDPDTDLLATVYYLYDDDFLYIAAQVTGDSTVVDTGMVDWVADSIEIWMINDEEKYSKISLGAYGAPLPNGAIGEFEDKLKLDYTDSQVAATQQEDGYIVEARVPYVYYDAAEDTIMLAAQVNNIFTVESNKNNVTEAIGGFYGYQMQEGTLYHLEGKEPLVTEEEPADVDDIGLEDEIEDLLISTNESSEATESEAVEVTTTEAVTETVTETAASGGNHTGLIVGIIAAVVVVAAVVIVVVKNKGKKK